MAYYVYINWPLHPLAASFLLPLAESVIPTTSFHLSSQSLIDDILSIPILIDLYNL